jgi:serine/threonine protein kinase
VFIHKCSPSFFLGAHENNVTTFEGMYSTVDCHYFVQEFCPTASLREAVYDSGGWCARVFFICIGFCKCAGLNEEHTKRVLKQILNGLEFMHGEGLVHRNLRSKNILIFDRQDFERVKITDFALTRKKNTQVRGGRVRVTLWLLSRRNTLTTPTNTTHPNCASSL